MSTAMPVAGSVAPSAATEAPRPWSTFMVSSEVVSPGAVAEEWEAESLVAAAGCGAPAMCVTL